MCRPFIKNHSTRVFNLPTWRNSNRPSFSALVTRWLSCVLSSATAWGSWARATVAAGKSAAYFFIAGVSQAAGVTAT